jgi:BON domain
MFTASPRNWRCDIPATRKLPMTKSRDAPSTFFSWDASIPTDKVQVKVEGGWITLSGQVEWYYEKLSAESAVRRISGVKGVSDMLTTCSLPTSRVVSRVRLNAKRA